MSDRDVRDQLVNAILGGSQAVVNRLLAARPNLAAERCPFSAPGPIREPRLLLLHPPHLLADAHAPARAAAGRWDIWPLAAEGDSENENEHEHDRERDPPFAFVLPVHYAIVALFQSAYDATEYGPRLDILHLLMDSLVRTGRTDVLAQPAAYCDSRTTIVLVQWSRCPIPLALLAPVHFVSFLRRLSARPGVQDALERATGMVAHASHVWSFPPPSHLRVPAAPAQHVNTGLSLWDAGRGLPRAEYADAALVLDSLSSAEHIAVHRAVLASGSDYLERLVSEAWTRGVEIRSGESRSAWMACLSFLYTGALPDLGGPGLGPCPAAFRAGLERLRFAHYVGIPRMAAACEEDLAGRVGAIEWGAHDDLAVAVLEVCDLLDCGRLRAAALPPLADFLGRGNSKGLLDSALGKFLSAHPEWWLLLMRSTRKI